MKKQTIRKPLMTMEEIDAAYPEHKKLREAETLIQGAEQLARYLLKQDIVLCKENPLSEDEHIAACEEEFGSYDSETDPYLPYIRPSGYNDSWNGVSREHLYAAFDISYDVIDREKKDMLEQLALAWQDAKEKETAK